MSQGDGVLRISSGDSEEPLTPFGRLLRQVAHVSEVSGDDIEATSIAAPLTAGRKITTSIELVRPLGEGGMGSVWLAHHAGLGSEVAVKFMSPGAERSSRRAARLAREAHLAASVRNPHVIQVFDHGVTDDQIPYIVMEKLEGETLAERLAGRGPLSLAEVGLLIEQVAEALSAAHGIGVIHRDIKPENLFLLRSGYALFVKLLDFGLAKPLRAEATTPVTRAGSCLGTPSYMSPEQLIDGCAADASSDLWALAVVAYQCVTCRLPFEGRTIAALGHALAGGAMLPAGRYRSDVPRGLDAWFARALARDPRGRFPTAAALAAGFALALRDDAPRLAGWPRAVIAGFVCAAAVAVLPWWSDSAWPWSPKSASVFAISDAVDAPVIVATSSGSNARLPPIASASPKPESRSHPRAAPLRAQPAPPPRTDCTNTHEAFMRDDEGYLVLKPECR